jgi:hypothetical protein
MDTINLSQSHRLQVLIWVNHCPRTFSSIFLALASVLVADPIFLEYFDLINQLARGRQLGFQHAC